MKKNGCTIAFAVISAIFIFMSCKPEVKIQTKEVEKLVEVDKKADEVAPADVTNLKATPKESRVLLTWTDAADEDVYGYEVSYSSADAGRVVLPALEKNAFIVAKGLGGTYVPNLTNGTEYTFTVKTVDTSGNKSQGVTAKSTPVCGDTIKMDLTVDVPHLNGYTGNKSNTYVTVTAKITSDSKVKKVMYREISEEYYVALFGGVDFDIQMGYFTEEMDAINYVLDYCTAESLFSDVNTISATENPKDNTEWSFVINATDSYKLEKYVEERFYQVAVIDEAGREDIKLIVIDNFEFEAPSNVLIMSADYSSASNSITFIWKEPSEEDYNHVEISYTSNDGSSDSVPSSAITVAKGTTQATFTGIDPTREYYSFTFTTFDDVGNKQTRYPYKVYISGVNDAPQSFVKVPGATVNGAIKGSNVFIEGRTVIIPDMYVCDHEVTQGEYETYCKYSDDYFPSEEYGVGENFPAYYINWYDAIVYCNLRSIAENLIPVYSIGEETNPANWERIVSQTTDGVTKYCGPSLSNSTWDSVVFNASANGYRLPTEAEWEYLAREANTSTTKYSGSNTIDDVAWCYSNAESKTHEVKGKDANALGVYDMSGNVWEWCYDWYSTIETTTAATGSPSGNGRINRGGSWDYDASYCIVSRRTNYATTLIYRYESRGFRVVRNAN